MQLRRRTFPLLITLLLAASCSGDDGTSPPNTGAVEVTAATTGSDLDSDGYTVTVDGGAGRSIGVNGSTTFTGLAAGDHQVELTDVAANCTVAGSNPRTATVSAGGTAPAAFDVTCALTTGSLEVTASTTGSTLDPDGYTVTVDGGTGQSIGINGSTTFAGVAAGEREVELTGVSSNCMVTGSNPRTVTVAAGGMASTSYDVACAVALRGQIAFGTSRDVGFEIYVMNADGSNPTSLTNGSGGTEPAISPDGTRIAFTTNRDGNFEVYVMDADGSNPVNLTSDPDTDSDPAWSPDGTRIAFHSDRDGNDEIYVMNADGSGQTNLTNDPTGDAVEPAWSPDGTRIAFTRFDANRDVYVMDADGSNPENLTNDPANDGGSAWSPDGTRIAFETNRDGNFEVYVMDADGSNPENLTNGSPTFDSFSPGWSPDGTRIALVTNRDGNSEVYVMDADGSSPARLTNDPGFDFWPDWSPE